MMRGPLPASGDVFWRRHNEELEALRAPPDRSWPTRIAWGVLIGGFALFAFVRKTQFFRFYAEDAPTSDSPPPPPVSMRLVLTRSWVYCLGVFVTFATTLEKVVVDTIEGGQMTKDLALLVGPDQKWLSTQGFLDAIDENLQKAMAG